MKLGVIIYSNDPEDVWNGFRVGNAALGYDDEVTIFLLGKGVECMTISSLKFNIKEQFEIFMEFGGNVIGCDLCANIREDTMPLIKESLKCEMGSMQTLYKVIKDSDKVLTF